MACGHHECPYHGKGVINQKRSLLISMLGCICQGLSQVFKHFYFKPAVGSVKDCNHKVLNDLLDAFNPHS